MPSFCATIQSSPPVMSAAVTEELLLAMTTIPWDAIRCSSAGLPVV